MSNRGICQLFLCETAVFPPSSSAVAGVLTVPLSASAIILECKTAVSSIPCHWLLGTAVCHPTYAKIRGQACEVGGAAGRRAAAG
ncbi:hypothetical protein [Candidatus Leptofilum sp.]|uniref:hypothetical protein n=1 Tax=Candidatus Leptofilum sp. TaxID=3241576 RepID=UPI003B5B3FA8